MKVRGLILVVLCASALAVSHVGGDPPIVTEFGDPLPGLDAAQLERFHAGKEAFEEEEFAEDGLGPVFTESSCLNCHNEPASGGGSALVETRIGRWVDGVFDPLIAFGGPVIQDKGLGEGIGLNGTYKFLGEIVPPQATVRAGRRATPTFGLGLVEAVADETLVQLAARQRRLHPGTAGRPHFVRDFSTGETRVGRFGWKAQIASLFDFSGDAYTNEMGITTPLVPNENCPQGDCDSLTRNPLLNGVPNEPDNLDLVLFADFMRFLAPPPRGAITRDVRLGNLVFHRIGCSQCHVQLLVTGSNSVLALHRVAFQPFSDFLLHDMGSLGDGIPQDNATATEIRTSPLWGLSAQTRFLHDARAVTIEEAILAHDGQGKVAGDRFRYLNESDRRTLLAFLRSL